MLALIHKGTIAESLVDNMLFEIRVIVTVYTDISYAQLFQCGYLVVLPDLDYLQRQNREKTKRTSLVLH